jgi:Carboxypeptidase regulatory-like domain
MRPRSGTLATTLLLLGLWSVAPGAAQAERRVRGTVADESGGVLPGVAVTALAPDGRVVATAVTDGAGRYRIGPLPAGPLSVTFELAGFSTAVAQIAAGPDAEAAVNPRLAIAARLESVDVRGRLPVPMPPPLPVVNSLPAPPRPVTRPVPEHDRDSVCGPAKIGSRVESFGTIRSRSRAANALYAAGDELTIDGGTLAGLEVGRNFVVRRTYRIEWEPRDESGEHTSGLLQIVAADELTARAVVIYACDAMMPGDRLAPFRAEPPHAVLPAAKPDYRHAARILFPDLGQMVGAPGRFMVIDRGAAAGVRAGQRVTLFRRESGRRTAVVGEAVVVAVRDDSATIRVERAIDAVLAGDEAALQR